MINKEAAFKSRCFNKGRDRVREAKRKLCGFLSSLRDSFP